MFVCRVANREIFFFDREIDLRQAASRWPARSDAGVGSTGRSNQKKKRPVVY